VNEKPNALSEGGRDGKGMRIRIIDLPVLLKRGVVGKLEEIGGGWMWWEMKLIEVVG
jgi:hypothetical protein